jgi:hypothetical protein
MGCEQRRREDLARRRLIGSVGIARDRPEPEREILES